MTGEKELNQLDHLRNEKYFKTHKLLSCLMKKHKSPNKFFLKKGKKFAQNQNIKGLNGTHQQNLYLGGRSKRMKIQDHPQVITKFKAILGYRKSCL